MQYILTEDEYEALQDGSALKEANEKVEVLTNGIKTMMTKVECGVYESPELMGRDKMLHMKLPFDDLPDVIRILTPRNKF